MTKGVTLDALCSLAFDTERLGSIEKRQGVVLDPKKAEEHLRKHKPARSERVPLALTEARRHRTYGL